MRCYYCMEDYNDEIDVICPYCGNDVVDLSNDSNCLCAGYVLKGRYVIGRVLGDGGFGITYIGYDLNLGRKIAIKEFFPQECATRQRGESEIVPHSGERGERYRKGLEGFKEEASRLANLGSVEGVVNVYDVFADNGTAYIVMEYIHGETVAQMMERKKHLGFGTTMNIIVPVLRSLDKVHKAGIIHRDVSPQNIMRTPEGKMVLIDFGAARQFSLTLNKSLSVVLKQGYAPVEQYDNKMQQASWTDVYATAATMYYMLTGVTPEYSYTRLLSDGLAPISELNPNLPPQLDDILAKALEVRPEDRTQTAGELLKQLMTLKDFKKNRNSASAQKKNETTKTMTPKSNPAMQKRKTDTEWSTYVHKRPIETSAVAEMDYRSKALSEEQVKLIRSQIAKDSRQEPQHAAEEPSSIKVSKPLIFVTILAFIVLAGLVGLGYFDSKTNVELPNFIGVNIDSILENTEYEFDFDVINTYNPDTELDIVLEQSPVSTARHVKKDSLVRLTVNSLDTEVTIPVLSKLNQAAAVSTLEGMHLHSEIIVVQDDGYEEGSVIRTEPRNGEKVRVLTTVKVYVAENSIPAPYIVGKSYDEALTELSELNLAVGEISYTYSEEYAEGYIVSQGIIKDTPLKKGAAIPIVVSLGAPYEVPISETVDLSGLKAPFKVTVMVGGVGDSEKTFYSLAFRNSYDFEVVRLNTEGTLPVNVYIDGELFVEYEFDFSSGTSTLVNTYEVSASKGSSDDDKGDSDKENSDTDTSSKNTTSDESKAESSKPIEEEQSEISKPTSTYSSTILNGPVVNSSVSPR